MPALFCRAKTFFHDTFNKDLILLPKPSSSVVVKTSRKASVTYTLNGFFQKFLVHMTITEQIWDAFGEKHTGDIR